MSNMKKEDFEKIKNENKILREWIQHIGFEAIKAHNDVYTDDFPLFVNHMVKQCFNQIDRVSDTPTLSDTPIAE